MWKKRSKHLRCTFTDSAVAFSPTVPAFFLFAHDEKDLTAVSFSAAVLPRVMNINCRDRCARKSDGSPIRTARAFESRQTDDKLSPDFLSSANRSRFMTARDYRRCENRFPVPPAIFSSRAGIILRCLKRHRVMPRVRLWINPPFEYTRHARARAHTHSGKK